MFVLLTAYQISVAALFLLLYRRLIFERNLLHVSFMFYVYFFLFNFLGSVLMYAERDYTNHRYFLATTLFPVVSLAGMVCFQEINRRIFQIRPSTLHMRSLLPLCLFITVVVGLYLATVDDIPLKYVLRGESAMATVARSLVTKEYEGPKILFYLYRLCVDYLFIFLLVFVYLKKSRLTGGIVLLYLVAVTISLLDIQKFPAVNITFFLLLAAYLEKRRSAEGLSPRVFLNKYILAMTAIGYIFIGILHGLFAGHDFGGGGESAAKSTVTFANSMIEDRLLLGQNRALYEIFHMVPEEYDYFFGKTLSNPLRILPYEPVNLSYLVYDQIHPEVSDIRGSAPAAFFGEVYANFGIAACFVSMFCFGFVVQFLNTILGDASQTAVAFRYMLMAYLAQFAIGFITVYVDEKAFFFAAMYFLLRAKKGEESPHAA